MTDALFDFDRLIDRRSLPSEKWGRYAGRDVLPLWVADMDFAAPPAVIEALHRRIDHGVFGYTDAWPALEQAVVEGLRRDHGWTIQPDWLVWLPGVVAGFNQRGPRLAVAEDAVIDAAAQGLEHRRRCGEVHVGDPQRQDVATGVLAPLEGVGAAPVDGRVEGAHTSRCW